MRKQSDSDLEDHHHRSDANHDPGAPFRLGKIGDKVVCLAKPRMIRTVHRFQSYAIFHGGKPDGEPDSSLAPAEYVVAGVSPAFEIDCSRHGCRYRKKGTAYAFI